MSDKEDYIRNQRREVYTRLANQSDKSLWRSASIRAVFFLAIFLTFDYFTNRSIFSDDYQGTAATTLLQLVMWYVLIVVVAYWFGRFERRTAAKKLEELA